MKNLYLTKYAQSPFGKLPTVSVDQMVAAAGKEKLDDIDRNLVDHVAITGLLTPLLNDQILLAGLVAMDPAYTNKSIKGVGNACDSGGLAVLDCALQILAGQAHIGLAIGLEKMNPTEGKLDSAKIGAALGTAAWRDDKFPPFTFPHAFAVIMERYMQAHGVSEQDFAAIPPIFYDNAKHNPFAHMQKTKEPITAEAVLKSYRLFSDPVLPLKLYECSQISDGWARILVCDDEGLKKLGVDKSQCTLLAGFSQITDNLAMGPRGDELLKPKGARKAFEQAVAMAGAKPEQIDLQEVHDCFSVMAALAVETTGFADAGKGVRFFQDGHANRDGKCPINTSGGLIAKGHPISATGIAMIGWVHWQLTHQVPAPLQVKNARLGTTLNIGGPIVSTVVTVLRSV